MPGLDETKEFVPLKIAVLTISDTRDLKDDKSGALLVQRIVAAGHYVAERSIVTDDIEAIRARVKAWIADPVIDVIITTGGTGFTGRDVTPEAIEPLFDKKMDGFSALFLVVSFPKIGTSAIQSRATAGVAGTTYIFCLPGSPGACKDAWDEILMHSYYRLPQDRHLGHSVARHRRRRRHHLHLLPARLARRLQGRLGRNLGAPARLSLRAVQLRRDHAAARRAPAPAESKGGCRL